MPSPPKRRSPRRIRGFRPGPEPLEPRALLTNLRPGFVETTLVTGLTRPTALDYAPDGRLFVAEQGGTLRVVKGGQLLPAPALTLAVDGRGERGLLGVAFDPQFAADHYVYVYHTIPATPTDAAHNRVSRFTLDGDVADPATERTLIDLDPLSDLTNHNGGAIHFGPDGTLYIGVGDNANGANAQSLDTTLGKILRIEADGSIPADNPFAASTSAAGANRAIWAIGLRNPFGFAFQPGTGRLYIDDVGESTWEEVDEGAVGANYGWPIAEGPAHDPRFLDPVFAYQHGPNSVNGSAITGGTFYDPASPRFPASDVGRYFFADLTGRWIHELDPQSRSVSVLATDLSGFPVGLVVDPAGGLDYLSLDLATGAGAIYAITYPDESGEAPAIGQPPQDADAYLGDTATFSAVATGAAPLAYQWQRNGQDIPGATSAAYATPPITAADLGAQYRVVVTNALGRAVSPPAILVGASPFVLSLYDAVLRRPADPAGATSWSLQQAQGIPPSRIAASFLGSHERHQLVVAQDYQTYLGRPVDALGLSVWTARLDAGAGEEDVVAALLGSGESFSRRGGQSAGFIDGLYRDLLGRAPDSGGLSTWVGRLATSSPAAVARAILDSPESRGRQILGWYQTYLARVPSPQEAATWQGLLQGGLTWEAAQLGFLASPEYFARAAARK